MPPSKNEAKTPAETETDAPKTWRDAWVDEARDALIAEIHAEAMAETRPGYEMKVAGSPAYQALKKAPVPERTAMARYLLANRSRIMARDGSRWTPTSHRPGFALYRPLPLPAPMEH